MKLLIYFVILATSLASFRPSLSEFGKKLKHAEQIKQLFTETKSQDDYRSRAQQVEKIISANSSLLVALSKAVFSQQDFVRGEVEEVETLNRVLSMAQVSLLSFRQHLQRKSEKEARESLHLWLTFASQFPFDEASLVSLHLAHLIRSLVFDELENAEQAWPHLLVKNEDWLNWLNSVKIPWPIDRIILSDARRSMNLKQLKAVEQAIIELQKNQYQTLAKVLDGVKGGQGNSLDVIRKYWREEDIEKMKIEVNRLAKLRIRFAVKVYRSKEGKPPEKIGQLVEKSYLNEVPLNYMTGKPFELDR